MPSKNRLKHEEQTLLRLNQIVYFHYVLVSSNMSHQVRFTNDCMDLSARLLSMTDTGIMSIMCVESGW